MLQLSLSGEKSHNEDSPKVLRVTSRIGWLAIAPAPHCYKGLFEDVAFQINRWKAPFRVKME